MGDGISVGTGMSVGEDGAAEEGNPEDCIAEDLCPTTGTSGPSSTVGLVGTGAVTVSASSSSAGDVGEGISVGTGISVGEGTAPRCSLLSCTKGTSGSSNASRGAGAVGTAVGTSNPSGLDSIGEGCSVGTGISVGESIADADSALAL